MLGTPYSYSPCIRPASRSLSRPLARVHGTLGSVFGASLRDAEVTLTHKNKKKSDCVGVNRRPLVQSVAYTG